jgi:uncharacterized membrane protein YphA (DoxX/SURF4 family)
MNRKESFLQLRAMAYHPLRLLLGAVFLYASLDKILHPGAFAQTVYNYKILPDSAINLAALTLPWLELIVGLCLVSGFGLPGATTISTSLLTLFIVVMAYNQIRGLDIHCGCFSTQTTEGSAGFSTLIRDVLFLIVSGYLALCVFFPRRVAVNVAKR